MSLFHPETRQRYLSLNHLAGSDQSQVTRNKHQERQIRRVLENEECHQENQSRSAKAQGVEKMLRGKVSAEKRGLARQRVRRPRRGARREGNCRERMAQRVTKKEGGQSSRTCVAIITMVGHSCNAGAYATEQRVAGWCTLAGYLLCIDYAFSLSLSLPVSFCLSRSLSLCINRGAIASSGSGIGWRPGSRLQVLSTLLRLTPLTAVRA